MTSPSDFEPADVKLGDVKSGDVKSGDVKSGDVKSGDVKSGDVKSGAKEVKPELPKEVGGPAGPEPTRFGDWEQKGRCTDF